MLSYTLFFLIFAIPGKSEDCPLGTYGETCDKNCSTHCAPSPSDKAVHCNKLTGMCSEGCKRGWHGDQCNFRCSRNCLNYVCEVQTGTCIECKANYSGEYCETYEGSWQKKSEKQSIQQNASAPVVMILVPVFVIVVVILIIIIILLIVYTRRRGFVWLQTKSELGPDECGQNLLADGGRNHIQNQNSELIDACKQGHLERVRCILEDSVDDFNKPGRGGLTPLMWAARRGHRELVELLVSKKADVNVVDDLGNNILHWACFGEHVAMVKHILSMNMVDVKRQGQDGRTPLMCAARLGNKGMFQLLVSKGGLSSQVDDTDGNSILHLACMGGNVEIVDYILSHDDVDINGRGQSGRTPLMAAAYRGHGKIFELLVTKGADLAIVDQIGDHVLHVACLGEHVAIVSRVLTFGKVDIDSRGHCRRTPLMMAARIGNKEIFDLLVKEGAGATLVDDDNNTILHLASKGGNLNIVKYVLSQKIVDINARNKHQETATMRTPGGSEVCNLLVSRGGRKK